MRRRRVGVIVADHVDADLQALEDRVIERAQGEPAVGAVHEVVRGAVIRLRRRHGIEAHRGLDHDIAESAEDGVSQDAAAAGPPVVGNRRVQISGDDVGDLVFEALLLVVGEGQVVRIGADPEVRRRPALRTGHEGHAGGGDEQRPREFTPCGMHAMLRAGPSEGERGAQVLHPVPERVRSGTGYTATSAYCDWRYPSTAYNPNTSSVPPALLMLM